MKFEDTHIGGIETGPVLFRTSGGPRCQDYFYYGRKLLGELKQRMQLGGVGFGEQDLILKNGVKLHALSNRIGLADIDEIWIDVTGMETVTTKKRCIGFALISYENFDESFHSEAAFKIKHPFDDRILAANSLDWEYPISDGYYNWEIFTGFPDNNAKYLDVLAYNDIIGDNEPGNFQTVEIMEFGGLGIYNMTPTVATRLYKYIDDYGFASVITGCNFDIPDNYTLTYAEEGYGSSCFIMIPMDNSWRFSFSDYLKSRILLPYPSTIFQESFGVPIVVPDGKYTIDVFGLSHRFEVKLLILEDGKKRFITKTKDYVATVNAAHSETTYAHSLTIEVGEFEDESKIINYSDTALI